MAEHCQECGSKLPDEPICRAIRKAARLSGRTQTEIAKALDMSQSGFSAWLRGTTVPTLDQIAAVEVHLGLRRGTLLRDAGYVDDIDGSGA